jgi:hypothetical protein
MLISYSLLVYAILEYLDSLATAPNRIFIGIQQKGKELAKKTYNIFCRNAMS